MIVITAMDELRAYLRECIKMIDDDVSKSDKIFGYYVDGKLSEDHRQLLKDKISEYYGSVRGLRVVIVNQIR